MRIAVHVREVEPFSFFNYRDNVIAELQKMGCSFVRFSSLSAINDVDMIWEPGIGGSRIPRMDILRLGIPVVVTCHGAAPFVLRRAENWHSAKWFVKERLMMWADRIVWFYLKQKVSGLIAVSEYGAQEIAAVFNISKEKIRYIYHGVNHSIFCEEGRREMNNGRPYFLCVAQSQPKKNIDRLLRAYEQLRLEAEFDLVLIIPGHTKSISSPGVRTIIEKQSAEDLAAWYRGALGLVFPSLHETFGFPIVEAMACGCPVITSNGTACKEVAGEAAILVDPRQENEISTAMLLLAENATLRENLKSKGLLQAQRFTWQASAECHFDAFSRAIQEN